MTQRRSHTASRAYFGQTAIADREQSVLDFLYDEGPHVTADIATQLELSRDHMSSILSNMCAAGLITKITMGKPQKAHWILVEDA